MQQFLLKVHSRFALLILLLVAGICSAEEYAKRLKISGYWIGDSLQGERVQWRDPRKDPQRGKLSGSISHADLTEHFLQIGPIKVYWDDSTFFSHFSPSQMTIGQSIEVSFTFAPDGRVLALQLDEEDPMEGGAVELIASVSAEQHFQNGITELTMAEIPVHVATAHINRARSLTRRQDDKRPRDQLTVQLFDRPLTIGGEFGTDTRYRENFALGEDSNDEGRFDTELQLELFYSLSDFTYLFVEGKGSAETEVYRQEGDREASQAFERGETWIYFDRVFDSNFGIQVGRQNFVEEREWWWDSDLDAVRVHYAKDFWSAEVAFARELAKVSTGDDRIDAEDEDIDRWLAHVAWRRSSRQLWEWFLVYQKDSSSSPALDAEIDEAREDESDADLAWLGMRVSGRHSVSDLRFNYWLDTAVVAGRESVLEFDSIGDGRSLVEQRRRRDVRGWALDVGVISTLPLRWDPTITLGYAIGSGGEENGDTDRAFRQTGLQDNNSKYNGVDRFRYYGELLRPELSNLNIFTLSVGMRLFASSSVELVFHKYTQREPGGSLRDSRLDADPVGLDTDIGTGIDLVLGLEEWRHFEVEAVVSQFTAGDAFGAQAGEKAHALQFKLNYNF